MLNWGTVTRTDAADEAAVPPEHLSLPAEIKEPHVSAFAYVYTPHPHTAYNFSSSTHIARH